MNPNDPVVVTPATAEAALHRAWEPDPPVFVIAPDGAVPAALVDAVRAGAGLAVPRGPSHRVVRRLAGRAVPITGPWALSGAAFRIAVPLAAGDGLGAGLAIDVVRAGYAVREVDLPLAPARRRLRRWDLLRLYWDRR